MINILKATSDGKINFSFTENLENVLLELKDDKYDGIIYTKYYDKIDRNIIYIIYLNSLIVPHIKKYYFELSVGDKKYIKNFKFESELLKGYSLIGNTCSVWRTYEKFNSTYTSPTIGHLILDDEKYVRFCEHIDSYLKANIIFGEVRDNLNFKKQTGSERYIHTIANIPDNYPVSHHLDIDIHWIHTRNKIISFENGNFTINEDYSKEISLDEFRDKWIRRVDRIKDNKKIFLWSASEMTNVHGDWERKQLIERFKKLPNMSIFLTERKEEEFEDDLHIVKYIPEWESFHQLQRNNFGDIKWNNQIKNAEIFKKIIEEKFL